jgi:Mn2+/Fe2+ NRAMP family transporter
MERDSEIINDSNTIPNYYLRSKKAKKKSNESIVKIFKIIIFYIAIITSIIFIIKQNNLSKIKQKKELTGIV